MKQFKLVSMAIVALALMMTSCDKDDDKDDDNGGTPNPQAKNVMLIVKPTINGVPVQLDTPVEIEGQTVSFQFLKFYISGIELLDDAGTVLADNEGLPILASTEQTAEVIGSTAAQHLHVLRFDVGLGPDLNHNDPITAPEPLDDVQMHWNWNTQGGYKFFRMDYNMSGQDIQSHAATDPLFQENVTLSVHHISTQDEHIHMELELDMATMLEGIGMANSSNHGPTPYNIAYMDTLGTGSPFSID